MKVLKKVFGIIALIYAAIGVRIFMNVQKPKTASHEKAKEFDMKQGSYTDEMLHEIPKEEVTIPSTMGYELHGWWVPSEGSDKTIILVHGITSNIYGSLKYYWLYRDMGFNVLLYDHRNHGKSGGSGTTLGYHEKHDLEACIEWVMDKVGPDSVIGTHGESMGAATVIQHASDYESVDFVVADCPFADLSRQLREVIGREQKLPLWIGLPGASLVSKLTGNGWYAESSPIRVIGEMTAPLLIIHGENDAYITPDHAQDLHDAKIKGYRELYFAKGADHAESIIKDRENYVETVTGFIDGVLS